MAVEFEGPATGRFAGGSVLRLSCERGFFGVSSLAFFAGPKGLNVSSSLTLEEKTSEVRLRGIEEFIGSGLTGIRTRLETRREAEVEPRDNRGLGLLVDATGVAGRGDPNGELASRRWSRLPCDSFLTDRLEDSDGD